MGPFELIHKIVKEKIVSAGFVYQSLENWPNFDRTIIPESWIGSGFSIFLEVDNSVPDSVDDNVVRVKVRIEFALDCINDAYLSQMLSMVLAVKLVRDEMEADLGDDLAVTPERDNWLTFYSENMGINMIATFDQIMIDVALN